MRSLIDVLEYCHHRLERTGDTSDFNNESAAAGLIRGRCDFRREWNSATCALVLFWVSKPEYPARPEP
jgi:hypothetical protein